MPARQADPLSDGIYTVASVCRILRPTMTRRKIRYWLGTGLISRGPLDQPGRGRPVLLTFRQLLEIRAVQQLRDELGIPLPAVRAAFAWILSRALESDEPVRFAKGQGGRLIAETDDGAVEIPGGQGALPSVHRLNTDVEALRRAWRDRALRLSEHVVSDPRIHRGAPTVIGTSIETAAIARLADGGAHDGRTVERVLAAYPRLSRAAIAGALAFEGRSGGAAA
ncbi:MAG: DUF433 domain-containing protein [Frankiaceae bacterium]